MEVKYAFLLQLSIALLALLVPSSLADDNFTHVQNCASKLSLKCGNATFFSVFDGRPKDIGAKCCQQLKRMGHKCHKDMVQSIITEEHYNKKRVPAILKRSNDLWNRCVEVSRHYMRYCEESLTEECGKAIFYYVFDGQTKGVKSECCEQIMNMGRSCHNDMVESILANDGYDDQEDEIHERSKKLWKQCTTGK